MQFWGNLHWCFDKCKTDKSYNSHPLSDKCLNVNVTIHIYTPYTQIEIYTWIMSLWHNLVQILCTCICCVNAHVVADQWFQWFSVPWIAPQGQITLKKTELFEFTLFFMWPAVNMTHPLHSYILYIYLIIYPIELNPPQFYHILSMY